MTGNMKNIDNLFRNASKEFEKEPPLYAWDKLNNDLDKKKKKIEAENVSQDLIDNIFGPDESEIKKEDS